MNSFRIAVERAVAEGRLQIVSGTISDSGVEGWLVPA